MSFDFSNLKTSINPVTKSYIASDEDGDFFAFTRKREKYEAISPAETTREEETPYTAVDFFETEIHCRIYNEDFTELRFTVAGEGKTLRQSWKNAVSLLRERIAAGHDNEVMKI